MQIIKKLFNIFNTLVSNRMSKWILIPCLLLLLWFTLSLTYSSYKSFTVLQYIHNQDAKNNFFEKKLLKGQKLSGEFEAKENNLGIIAVKFGRVPKVNLGKENVILFRIKEKNHSNWFYENNYKSSLIKSYQYLTFGFIPIKYSKGKIYKFEIVSLNGNKDNAMETIGTNPIYLSKYKFSKSEVFENWKSFMKFMSNKILTFYTDYDTLVSSLVFFLPFVFYLTWIIVIQNIKVFENTSPDLKNKRQISKIVFSKKFFRYYEIQIAKIVFSKKFFNFLVLTLIFGDIVFLKDLITGVMLGSLGFWIFAIYLNNFKSKVNFIMAFIIILLSVFDIYLNWKISVDIASTFAFMFMVIGLLQILFEYKSTNIRN